MKIALPTHNNQVEEHFGRSTSFTVVEVNSQHRIAQKQIYQASQGLGCKSNTASVLRRMGIKALLANGMGERSARMLKDAGIEVLRGCSGTVEGVVHAYLRNELTDNY